MSNYQPSLTSSQVVYKGPSTTQYNIPVNNVTYTTNTSIQPQMETRYDNYTGSTPGYRPVTISSGTGLPQSTLVTSQLSGPTYASSTTYQTPHHLASPQLAPRRDLQLFDTYLNGQDEYSQEVKDIVGMMSENTLDFSDVLVYGHEALNLPENQHKLPANRSNIVRVHNEMKKETLLYRQKMARLVEDFKYTLPQDKNLSLREALQNVNNPLPNQQPERTARHLRNNRDDLCLIIDPDITGLERNRYSEKNLARAKRQEMSFGEKVVTQVINQAAPSTSHIKIKLDHESRYLNHEIKQTNPADEVKVIIDKTPASVYVPPPVVQTYIQPTPQVIRTASPAPPTPTRSRTPQKSRISMGTSVMEEVVPKTEFVTVKREAPQQAIVRDFTPTKSASKMRESFNVIQEPEPVRIDERLKHVVYSEPRNQQLLQAQNRTEWFKNHDIQAYESGDRKCLIRIAQAYKVELNNRADSLYLAGGSGLSKMAVNNGKLTSQIQGQPGNRS